MYSAGFSAYFHHPLLPRKALKRFRVTMKFQYNGDTLRKPLKNLADRNIILTGEVAIIQEFESLSQYIINLGENFD
jgi:hypothetical protein